MKKKEIKHHAQDLIMQQLSIIGYGTDFKNYCSDTGENKTTPEILKQQIDRVAKLFGYDSAWFS